MLLSAGVDQRSLCGRQKLGPAADAAESRLDELLHAVPRLLRLLLKLLLDAAPPAAGPPGPPASPRGRRARGRLPFCVSERCAPLRRTGATPEGRPLRRLRSVASDAVAALAELADDPVAGDRAAPLEATHVATHTVDLALGAGPPGPGLDRSDDPVAHLEGGADRHEQRDSATPVTWVTMLSACLASALTRCEAAARAERVAAVVRRRAACRRRVPATLAGGATRSLCRCVVPFGFEPTVAVAVERLRLVLAAALCGGAARGS